MHNAKSIISGLLIAVLFFGLACGAEQYVSSVIFKGNDSFSSRTLTKYIRLKPKGIFKQSIYSPRALKLDVISLRTFYQSEGFIDVSIESEIKIADEQFIDIFLIISEGHQYTVNSLQIFGDHLFTKEKIRKILDIRVSDVYNPAKLTSRIKTLENEYLKNGKLLNSIADEIEVQSGKVNIRINISEGATYYIGEITISGLSKVSEKYVRRELIVKPSELYNISKIEKSQRRIFSSGLFSSVEIYPVVAAENEHLVNINIKVREYDARNVQFDFGIGQEASTLGAGAPPATVVGIEGKWLPGTLYNTANRIELGGQIGVRVDQKMSFLPWNIYVNWFNPWLFGFRVPVRLKYIYEELKDEYALSRQGIEMSLIYKQGESYNFVGGFKLEDIRTKGDTAVVNTSLELDRKINFSFFRQKLDNFIMPTSGYFYSVSLDLNGTFLGGSKHFLKFDSEIKKFYPLKNNSTFGQRIKLGYLHIFAKSTESDLEFYDKFWLGGNTSLRGWNSPKAYNPNGALIRLQYNAEMRFPLYKKIGGEIFFDSGKLADSFDKNIYAKWSWDTGAGVTFLTPIGPARIDVAYPFAKKVQPVVLLSLLFMF